jgi:hypothetical protein
MSQLYSRAAGGEWRQLAMGRMKSPLAASPLPPFSAWTIKMVDNVTDL